MTYFCEIKIPSTIKETQKSYRIQKTSESGHTRTRPLGRLTKKEFNLSWNGLSSNDKSTLQTFFDDNYSLNFIWIHPETEVEYTVYFVSDKVEYETIVIGVWKTSLTLGEV